MKNRLWTAAGVLALLAVTGKFYAIPALAQAARAVLVQDRDNPARQPFSIELDVSGSATANIPLPPAGKRMVITGMSFDVEQPSASSVDALALGTSEGRMYHNRFVLDRVPGLNVFSGGFTPQWVLDPDASTATILFDTQGLVSTFQATTIVTGYYIDIP